MAPRKLVVISHACSRAVNRRPYRALLELGWKVDLVTTDALQQDGRRVASDPAAAGDPVTWFLPLSSQNTRLYHFVGLPALVAQLRPDWVIVDNDPHSLLAVELVGLKRKLGFQLGFLSCENLSFGVLALARRRGLRGLALGMFLAWCRWRVRAATDLLLVINAAGKTLFEQAGYRRVVRTPLGFPEEFFRVDATTRARLRTQLELRGPVVGYFGRLTEEKGVHLLVDALEQLFEQQWTLLLDHFQATSDYQQRLRERLSSARWSGRVRWIEAGHGEVAGYMNATDVVVLPSVSSPRWVEQYGRVAPEAMACGCLVIAAASGALPELVGGSGWLFPEADVTALRTLLSRACSELEQLSDLRQAAAEHARTRFSATAQARLWHVELGGSPA